MKMWKFHYFTDKAIMRFLNKLRCHKLLASMMQIYIIFLN